MTELKKWIPFRFNRGRVGNAAVANGSPAPMSLTTMRDEMDRMLERFWTNPLGALDLPERWFGDFSSPDFQPRLDVTDDKNFLRITCEVPGVDASDLEVEVQDGVLTLTGQKRRDETSESEGCYHTERSYGYFRRSIPMPSEVDSAKAEAKFDKGVLTVRLPKTERGKQQATKVAIKS